MRAATAFLGLLPPLLLASLFSLRAQANPCTAQSGESTAALLELYTSQGCTSCPPAERWLSGVGARGDVPGRVVPLALHVDYGDYTGWKERDPHARQRKLTPLQRRALVYSPQVVLQGREFRHWKSAAFERELKRINAQPARARLRLQIQSIKPGTLEVEASAELLRGAASGDSALYLAAYENKPPSAPGYVVLEWLGPFRFDRTGRRVERRELPLLPEAIPGNSGVVGFVQDRRTGEVLQALMLPVCPRGKG